MFVSAGALLNVYLIRPSLLIANEYTSLGVIDFPFATAILSMDTRRHGPFFGKIGAVYSNHTVWVVCDVSNLL